MRMEISIGRWVSVNEYTNQWVFVDGAILNGVFECVCQCVTVLTRDRTEMPKYSIIYINF